MNVSCEIAIAAANAKAETARARIARTDRAIERAFTLGRETGDLRRKAATLHLHDTSPQQCVVMIAELQRLSVSERLRLMSVSREAASVVAQRAEAPHDTYAVTLEGSYARTLALLDAVGELPLVVKLTTVTFERISHRRRPADDVRTSIQLEVFRMTKSDAARSS